MPVLDRLRQYNGQERAQKENLQRPELHGDSEEQGGPRLQQKDKWCLPDCRGWDDKGGKRI